MSEVGAAIQPSREGCHRELHDRQHAVLLVAGMFRLGSLGMARAATVLAAGASQLLRFGINLTGYDRTPSSWPPRR